MSEAQKYLEVTNWGKWEAPPRRRTPRRVRSLIEEIRSGAVTPDDDAPGCFVVEVVTASGARRFREAREVGQGDTQSESTPAAWGTTVNAEVIHGMLAMATKLLVEAQSRSSVSQGEKISLLAAKSLDSCLRPRESPSEEILHTLKNPKTGRDEYRRAITDAEILDLTPLEMQSLTPLLREFIEKHRESNDPSDLVAVGSAIRKFIAIAQGDEAIDFAGSLLKAGDRLPLPISIEVELSKMVVRKLTANPPAGENQYPELADRLRELADTYLNPRLLGREKHGAVALNAVLGVVLTRDAGYAPIIDRVRSLDVSWFRQLLVRQARILASDLQRRWGSETYPDLLRALQELSAAASPGSSK